MGYAAKSKQDSPLLSGMRKYSNGTYLDEKYFGDACKLAQKGYDEKTLSTIRLKAFLDATFLQNIFNIFTTQKSLPLQSFNNSKQRFTASHEHIEALLHHIHF